MELKDFSYYFDLADFKHKEIFANCEHVFDVFKKIAEYLALNLKPRILGEVMPGAYIDKDVYLGQGSRVEAGAWINGPAIIGENCHIRQGAYIRANVILGDRVVVGHASEINNSILLNEARAPHFAYVGDSILGNRVNLGAGAILSNFKLIGQEIEIGGVNTGLKKMGAIIGDDSSIGCNSVCQPGALIGKNVSCYPGAILRGFIASDKIIKVKQSQEIVDKY